MRISSLFLALLLSAPVCCQWLDMDGGIYYGVARQIVYDSTQAQTYLFGSFEWAGQDTAEVSGAAIWKNEQWSAMGTGVNSSAQNNPINAAQMLNDRVYVGGGFDSIHGLPNTRNLAIWNADHWEEWGNVASSGVVHRMEQIDGKIHVVGHFDSIAGVPMNNWGIWDGANWQAGDTTAGALDLFAYAVAKYQGEFYVGGNFHPDNGPHDIAKLGPNGWEAVGGGIFGDPWVNDMLVYNELLFVAGNFFNWSGNAASGVMAWDGSQWIDPFPPIEFLTQVSELEVIGGRLVMNGTLQVDGNTERYGMAWYNGEQICIFGGENIKVWDHGGVADTVYASFCQTLDCQQNGPPVNHIAKWVLTNPVDTCISLSVGVAEMEGQSPIASYPNPAHDHVRVQFVENSQGTLQLYDLVGRITYQADLVPNTTEYKIDVSTLDPGQYLLRWRSADGTEVWNSRLIVAR